MFLPPHAGHRARTGPGTFLKARFSRMNVVIVESVAKAKAINKYLGANYQVLASYGHVRDLPSKDGSVEPDNDFRMHWDVDGRSAKVMKDIADAVRKADKLILATDPDREGEAISWHILRILEGPEEGAERRARHLQRRHQAVGP
jgi:DNA topoisomerase IA